MGEASWFQLVGSIGCRLLAVEPVGWDQGVTAAPALDYRVREPVVLEVRVVERDHLQPAAKLLHDLEGQLVEPACVLAVGVGQLVEVAAGLAVARKERLAGLVEDEERRDGPLVSR